MDNLDDVIKSTEEDKKPLLIAGDRKSHKQLCSKFRSAMLKKYDYNKYILCIENQYIEKKWKKKFEILRCSKGHKYR